jgi:hypothetical protein
MSDESNKWEDKLAILETKLVGKKGEGSVDQRLSDLLESLNASDTFQRDFDDMTLKNSMPIKSKQSASNKFSSHTMGSRNPFEPIASDGGTMLRGDIEG